MHLLEQEEPERAQALASVGGPETLLHGDLWPTNAIVRSRGDGFSVRLIDWDEAAAGPSWFDVSTLLLRFDSVAPPVDPGRLPPGRRPARGLAPFPPTGT